MSESTANAPIRGGVRLHYERRGQGEPLLLITGFGLSAAVFDPVIEPYTERFECILYDSRGAGRSPAPLWPTSMAELAADAAGLLQELGIDSAHVFGISMGGMVALELALRFPERVRGLVLCGTTPGGPRAVIPTPRELGALGGAVVGRLREPGRPWLAGFLFSPEFRRRHPQRVLELIEPFKRHPPPPHGVAAHWWASVYHDTVSRLGQIQSPTLVMHGGRDAMAPIANAHLLAERIPDAELSIVPGSGHAFPLEKPGETERRIFDWYERRSPIGPGQPRTGPTRQAERLTRAFGLPIGALRTGASLVGRAVEQARGGRPAR